MIYIVFFSCTQRKLRAEGVPFYTEKQFYDNIDMVFVTPCPRHPFLKNVLDLNLKIYAAIALTSKKEDVITVKLYNLILIFWQTR